MATPKARHLEIYLERSDCEQSWGFNWRPSSKRWILDSLGTSVFQSWHLGI